MLSGIEHAQTYFAIVFVVVLASLLLQGMSIGYAGRKLKVVLPPRPDAPPRLEIDLPSGAGRNLAVYTVQPSSLALRRPLARLRLPEGARLLSVIRDGTVHPADGIGALAPGDEALLITPGEHLAVLDRIFGAPQAYLLQGEVDLIGEFPFDASTPIGAIAEAYGFTVPKGQEDWSVGRFLGTHLLGRPAPGRRLCLGQVELLVQRIEACEITRVSIEVEPTSWTLHRLDPLHIWLRSKLWLPIFRRFERLRERSAAGTEPE